MVKNASERQELAAFLFAALEPAAQSLELQMLDVDCGSEVLQITLEDPNGLIDSTRLEAASHALSAELDVIPNVDAVYSGRYMLEVSSPGVERLLRTIEHFRRCLGSKVNIKLTSIEPGERRISGWIMGAENEIVRIAIDTFISPKDVREIPIDRIERAKTVFEWLGGEKKIDSGRGTARK